ncbi:hypothetical protein BGW36DRAFT_380134 [Talaromyces proteolyticus]|uniref:Uncharacterized protein n=1 Tax=Talaromyces proteolyticus TaxID=1131652 RepID=A0AAD4PZM8_9EURO|nr:uncharacterized protein BGW36DRAFT_380134 [Talaromyces proteolyticus]KAH8696053.1 hypothetical protein BGW36DRAFT_380134 [Talaromyces proteolyticus]
MGLKPPAVNILYYDEPSEAWLQDTIYDLDPSNFPECSYIFVPVKRYPVNEEERIAILRKFNAPDILASRMCHEINGYCGSKVYYNEEDKLRSYSTWFRCLVKMILDEPLPNGKDYKWYEMTIVSRWDFNGQRRILCIDTPDDFPRHMQDALQNKAPDSRDPFAMHLPLMDQIVRLNDESVWAIRDPIREIEKRRPTAGPDFEAMHEISRHSIHVSEVLHVTIQTFEKLLEQQKKVHARLPIPLAAEYCEQVNEYLDFQIQMLKSLKERSISNYSRLKSEITVAYNRIVQQDNRVMKSIAFLTMIFLPATFISAIFNTTFFQFGEDQLQASKQLWIYWVVTIPSTLIIVVFWRSLLNRNPPVTWKSIWNMIKFDEARQKRRKMMEEKNAIVV